MQALVKCMNKRDISHNDNSAKGIHPATPNTVQISDAKLLFIVFLNVDSTCRRLLFVLRFPLHLHFGSGKVNGKQFGK